MNTFHLTGGMPKAKALYLDETEWAEKRNALAASMLAREAANLMAGRPVQNPALIDAALETAGWTMAEIGIVPESTRADIEDAA